MQQEGRAVPGAFTFILDTALDIAQQRLVVRVVAADRYQEIAAEEGIHLGHGERSLGGSGRR